MENLNELMAGLDEGDSVRINKNDNDLASVVGLRMNDNKATIVSLEKVEFDKEETIVANLTIVDTMLADNDYTGRMSRTQLGKYIKQLKEIYKQM